MSSCLFFGNVKQVILFIIITHDEMLQKMSQFSDDVERIDQLVHGV